MPSSWCGVGWSVADRIGSADLEHMVDLSLAAWRGLTASLCTLDLPFADVCEDSAEDPMQCPGALKASQFALLWHCGRKGQVFTSGGFL
jgi:hypothetical protein